jgi:hypothetical protein
MKRILFLSVAIALAGCGDRQHGRASHGPGEGRYLGLGIYDPDALWQELAAAEQPKDPKAATLADDSEILVVVDSVTGEVRQCGNMSGHCIAINPWRGAGGGPVALNKHSADLADDPVDAPARTPSRAQP